MSLSFPKKIVSRLSNQIWRITCVFLFSLFFGLSLSAQPRLAILDFIGERDASNYLRQHATDNAYSLVEPAQLEPALKGAGYGGSLNLSVDEARALGLSIGCDYYLLGVARIQRRLLSEKEFYFDVLVAAFLIETQTGNLLRFSFEKNRLENESEAPQQLLMLTEKIWRHSADAIKSAKIQKEIYSMSDSYDLSSAEAAKLKIKPPQFFRRLKPVYTEAADLAGIAAIIELKVIFQADGQIGPVEVVRWGGFGLDESAIATVRQLRFEPAKLNGQSVNVSAIVQYNFRQEEKNK